ncbi:tRNA1(Val) (adenine(37)-N6)-methyltransferase [Aureimonas jatrophae]|nr:methyltransferase [Aureimonas jatrophae]
MAAETSEPSLDAFLNGRFHLWQSATGLRAGHDALLVAAAVPAEAAGRAIDMGAGTGAVGFASALRAPALHVVLAEREPTLLHLLRRSVDTAPEPLGARLSVAEIDLLSRRPEREEAGLCDGAFDWVVTNPPFHPANGRLSPDAMRARALTMPDPAFLSRWVAVAATLLRSGGRFIALGRPENLPVVLAAADNRLGSMAILPIHNEGRRAHRVLVTAVRGSRAPLRILPSFQLDDSARRQLSAGDALPVPVLE